MTSALKAVALAAATLCLAAPCAAQSTARIYGVVDMSAGRFQEAGTPNVKRAQSGTMTTSHIGFSGSEQLAGTVKAKFAIESFLRADGGEAGRFNGDAFWARAAWVGLEGDFGSTVIGRTTNQFFVSTLIFNAFGDSFGFSPSIRQVLTPTNAHPQMLPFLGDTGWSNSLLYTSPSLGGLRFNLQGSLGEGAAGTTGHNLGANAVYFGGPFAATVAVQRVKQGINAGTTPVVAIGFDHQDSAQVGLSYDFGAAKLFGQASQVKTEAATDTKTVTYGLGVSAPVGPGKVLAQYGHSTAERPTGDVVNKTLTIGYDYMLSKSTDVYLVGMNDKLSGLTPAVNDGNTVAVGLRMRF